MSINRNTKSGIIGVWLGLLIGAVVAGTVALIFAPGTGKETRAAMKKRFIGAGEAIIWHAREEVRNLENRNEKRKK